MGFFSWRCAVSDISIANVYAGMDPWQSECYLVLPDRTIKETGYEGYGIFGGHDVYEIVGNGDRIKGIEETIDGTAKIKIKIVLSRFYNGQKYEDLPESKRCPHQGYFFDDGWI